MFSSSSSLLTHRLPSSRFSLPQSLGLLKYYELVPQFSFVCSTLLKKRSIRREKGPCCWFSLVCFFQFSFCVVFRTLLVFVLVSQFETCKNVCPLVFPKIFLEKSSRLSGAVLLVNSSSHEGSVDIIFLLIDNNICCTPSLTFCFLYVSMNH